MRLNSKEDFHPCQESVTEKAKITEFPDDVSASIDDGASMVHCIVPDTEGNYKEYSEKFIQHGEIKINEINTKALDNCYHAALSFEICANFFFFTLTAGMKCLMSIFHIA